MPSEPRHDDAVLGGQVSLNSAVVLGGLLGVKHRLANPLPTTRCQALFDALRYGSAGVELLTQVARQSDDLELRWIAFSILCVQDTPKMISQLEQRYKTSSEPGGKNFLLASLKQELELYTGAKMGINFPIPGVAIADVAVVFATGYVLALMCPQTPITPEELSEQTSAFMSAGVDVIWILADAANTQDNFKWLVNNYNICYRLSCPSTDEFELRSLTKAGYDLIRYRMSRLNYYLESGGFVSDLFWRFLEDEIPDLDFMDDHLEEIVQEQLERYELQLANGNIDSFDSSYIFSRAVRQTFHTWRRLSNDQIKRGLRVQNKGVHCLSGVLGALNSHQNHTKITAIAKISPNVWQVTDNKQLTRSSENLALFPPAGVAAMKQRAKAIAKILPRSS
jgi:predicted transcriptional regulator